MTNSNDCDAFLKAPQHVMKKWGDLTYGLFMHWDMSSLLGVEISWAKQSRLDVKGEGEIPDEIYENLYRSFNPQEFDARAMAKVAVDAGMRYVVLTTKHHGGFCMFDSKLTDYKITSTAFGRDVFKELADACREAGLKVGVYYSQPDWHHPDFIKKDFDAYRPYFYGQLRELLTNYGKIDMLFFDGLFYGEKEYKTRELFKMLRTLQPEIVINERCGLPADYKCPEQVVGAFNNRDYWESCMTLGTSWSWKTNDRFKSSEECIKILSQTVGGDGNLLLNVGPMPTGRIEPRQAKILKGIGDWLRQYGESMYGAGGGPYKPAGWGACTHQGNVVYMHVQSWFDAPDYFPKLTPRRIMKAELMTGGEVKVEESDQGLRFVVAEKDRATPLTLIKLTLHGAAADIEPMLIPTKSLARGAKVTVSVNQDQAQNLVDDNPETEWKSDSRQCWAEIDLGRDVEFDRIDIREEGHEWEVRTTDFVLCIKESAAREWTVLDKGNKIGHTYSKCFDRKKARYVKLEIRDAGVLPKFAEIQVYDRQGQA